MQPFSSTADVAIPTRRIDQVIGQEEAVHIVRLAARQRRFLLIIGDPGTGKSMLGRAVAELMTLHQPVPSVVSLPNAQDPLRPRMHACAPEAAADMLRAAASKAKRADGSRRFCIALAMAAVAVLAVYWSLRLESAVYACAGVIGCGLLTRLWPRHMRQALLPKILVRGGDAVPFVDATGCSEGALFGDVRHDPYQSGGVETAAHQLVEAGAIHRAHGGVLYIDEVATLQPQAQELLLTAIQEKELAITGRSPGSSGTMIMTAPVPCDFVLVLAGNPQDVAGLHPALRSRLQGYGYELRTRSVMPDDAHHHALLAQLAAQEIRRDGRIPHADPSAVQALIAEARRRAGIPGSLTSRFRELGGVLRIAGDLAVRDAVPLIQAQHIEAAVHLARPYEGP